MLAAIAASFTACSPLRMNPEITLYGSHPGAEAPIVIVGLPYGRGTSQSRQGAADGPDALREASCPFGIRLRGGRLVDLASGQELACGSDVSDLGNIRFKPETHTDDGYLNFVTQASKAIFADRKKPLFLGGDHLITLAILRGLKEAGQRVQVVHLDAHSDFGELIEGERPTHGTFMGLVNRERLAERVLQIGVRGLDWGEALLPDHFRRVQVADLGQHLLPGLPVYLTVDTDAFDPSFAPAVSYPQPDGLNLSSLRDVLSGLRGQGLTLVGADWVEYNPAFDTGNRMTASFICVGLGLIIHELTGRRN